MQKHDTQAGYIQLCYRVVVHFGVLEVGIGLSHHLPVDSLMLEDPRQAIAIISNVVS